jgi:hypothetical protein
MAAGSVEEKRIAGLKQIGSDRRDGSRAGSDRRISGDKALSSDISA